MNSLRQKRHKMHAEAAAEDAAERLKRSLGAELAAKDAPFDLV
jgi:hypothetical protein